MSNFNSLGMAKTISENPDIETRKSWFSTKVYYTPSQSRVKAFKTACAIDTGESLKLLLNSKDYDSMSRMVTSMGRFEEKANGNYLLQGCISEDHKFVALQLYQFIGFAYEPVSDIRIFTGEDAYMVGLLF